MRERHEQEVSKECRSAADTRIELDIRWPYPDVDVPAALSARTRPRRDRNPRYLHRCYDKAYKYVIDHSDLPAVLVHGLIYRVRIPHAWVEIPLADGRCVVFDGNYQRFTDRDSYYQYGCIVLRRYGVVEAAKAMLAAGHMGPWEAEEDFLRLIDGGGLRGPSSTDDVALETGPGEHPR